tara:strand:- start:220 stop:771 length:552 start_codon:yes stop_codon:yes gene_type:complete
MDHNHSISFAPSFSLVVRHVVLRFGTFVLKILWIIITILLSALLHIGSAFSKLTHRASARVWIPAMAARNMNAENTEPGHGRIGPGGEVGGQNGVPEGWVRYVICRTEDISDFDLDDCEGCRQVLETDIEMPSGKEESAEELSERMRRVEGWLVGVENLERDSGYSSPEAVVEGEVLWGLPRN